MELKTKWKKRIAVIIAVVAVLAVGVVIGMAIGRAQKTEPVTKEKTLKENENEQFESAITIPGNIQIGDVITLGHCEQDNDTTNGAEAIEWVVLDKQDGRALIISKYGLEKRAYHPEEVNITWADCELRGWLNSEFMDSAFSSQEQEVIMETTIITSDNASTHSKGGNNTQDWLFLLSVEEINRYYPTDEERLCKPTAYAIACGAYADDAGNGWWWLRSPGMRQKDAAVVCVDGYMNEMGNYVHYEKCIVRPAMWIELG